MSCHAKQYQNLLYILCSGAAPSFVWVLNPTSKSLNYLHMKYEHLSVGRNYNKNIEKCYYKKLKQQIGKFVFLINLIILQTSPPPPPGHLEAFFRAGARHLYLTSFSHRPGIVFPLSICAAFCCEHMS